MTERDPLQELYAVMDASDAAFNAGDLSGWQAAVHPSLHSFQGDHFTSLADFQGAASESQLAERRMEADLA